MSAIAGGKLFNQTMKTLKCIRSDEPFDTNLRKCSRKEESIEENVKNIRNPILKRKTNARAIYSMGKAPDEHLTTPRDNYRRVYFETLDLLKSQI